jgi:hypothetical protein
MIRNTVIPGAKGTLVISSPDNKNYIVEKVGQGDV